MQESTNNIARLSGTIASEIIFSHKIYQERFYEFKINIKRLSNTFDTLPITVSEKLMSTLKNFECGQNINVLGQIRSYNNFDSESNRTKLVLTIFAHEIFLKQSDVHDLNPNLINITGFVCKAPVFRTTPFGREISDILLAVNRSYNKSDYIPCIAWGRNAQLASELNISDKIKIIGRMQSREYQKKISDNQILNKIAYELSISKLEKQT